MKMKCTLTKKQIEGAISFHGHSCPGIAIGLRTAEWCLRELGHAGEEDITAVVETDMCAVDAIQYLTGCTFGKNNFIYRDTGKVAFSFFRRRDNKRGRLTMNPNFAPDLRLKQESISPDQKEKMELLKQEIIDRMLNVDLDELFIITVPEGEIPVKPQAYKTIRCEECGERVIETKLVTVNNKRICVDCATKNLV